MNDFFDYLILALVIAICLVGFFAPTIIAFIRGHHYRWIIFGINIVFGATGFGYLIAFVWAVWPNRTGLSDVIVNDLTTNTAEANHEIYQRYGQNLDTLRSAKLHKEKEYWLSNQGKQIGPYSSSEIRSMVLSGKVNLTDLIWHQGAVDWMPIQSFSEFSLHSAPPPFPPS